MKLNLRLQFVFVLGLLTALTLLFLNSRSISGDAHARVLQDVHAIIEADAELNRDVLLSRAGLLRHYDSINASMARTRASLSRVQNSLQQALGELPPELRDSHARMVSQFGQKETLVERFKMHNAVLQNSLSYFSLVSNRLMHTEEADDGSDPGGVIGRLSNQVFRAIRAPDGNSDVAIRELVAQLAELPAGEQSRTQMLQLSSHAELILDRMPVLTGTLQALLRSDLQAEAEQVLEAYLDVYARREARAVQFRSLSFLTSVILVIYLIRLFVRLKSGALALQRSNRALAEEKRRAEITLQSIADGVITTDRQGDVQYLNPVAQRLTGWSTQQALGQPLAEVFRVFNRDLETAAPDPVRLCLDSDRVISWHREHTLLSRNGPEHIVQLSAAPMHGRKDKPLGAVLIFHDVSDTFALIARISHQASHDSLTELVNRGEFERRLQTAILNAQQYHKTHALCYIDLDQFKVVNDSCGHSAGDQLLKQLAQLLNASVRPSDTLARLGGDEFGVLLSNCTLAKAQRIAAQLHKLIQEYRFVWHDRMFDVGASIGIALIDHHASDPAQLLSQVDMACYAAKDLGRNRIHVYQESDAELLRRESELHWASSITRALEENRLCLYCQAIQSTGDGDEKTRRYEVLVRLVEEDGNKVAPGAFIPAAERYNLMDDIDRWVIDQALRALASLPSRRTLQFSINLSGNSISDPGLLTFIENKLEQYDIQAGQVCFEITETAAILNLSHAIDLIESLRNLGCRFALDDFGAGLSSFTYLKTLPVDYIKIDGSFVRDMQEDQIGFAMVEAINHVGHIMGKHTVAEFVENDAILESLRRLGVDFAQGYGIGTPMPIETLGQEQPHRQYEPA